MIFSTFASDTGSLEDLLFNSLPISCLSGPTIISNHTLTLHRYDGVGPHLVEKYNHVFVD